MLQELVNSNHTPNSKASRVSLPEVGALGTLLAPFGAAVLYTGESVRRLAEDEAELGRLRALAASPSTEPSRLWTVRQFAKQAGISEKAARRLVRKLGGFCVAQSHCCSCPGGKRGCDYRLEAARGVGWVNSRRRQRAAR